VKTVHFASILVLTVATAFACNDDGDRVEGGNAGSAGKNAAAGSAGKPNVAGSSNNSAGAGGGHAGAANEGGAAGNAGSSDGGVAGVGGANEGGAAGGGAAGETSDAGAAGTTFGGEGGAGGAPEVPDVVVPGPGALIGTWDTNFGGTDVITANTWNGANIVAYTSGVRAVYAHNPASDPYNPRKFSKYVYTEPVSDSFYYCWIVYNADTLAAAQADTAVPDASEPDVDGCGSFNSPWTKLTKQ